MNSIEIQNNISLICRSQYSYFLRKSNVEGVGLGYKIKNGFKTCKLCIQVFVSRKIPKRELFPKEVIPMYFKGIVTDVIETGIFRASSLTKKIRPVIGGYCIGPNIDNINGSAGCLVTNGVRNFVLCTNHVLANENLLPIGSPILQPSYVFRGRVRRDSIATLFRYVPMRFIEGEHEPLNYSDCAIGLLEPQDVLRPEIAFIGKPTCVKSPTLNAPVQKVGSITELTEGTIRNVSTVIRATYPSGKTALFDDCISTTKMGEEGDSGSILLNKNMCAIGLLFGTSNNSTVYNRLDRVLDQLDVQLTK